LARCVPAQFAGVASFILFDKKPDMRARANAKAAGRQAKPARISGVTA